jgi:hypothetical protein
VTNTLITAPEAFSLTEGGTMPGTSPFVRRQYSPKRLAAMDVAHRLIESTFKGDIRASVLLREALSTDDLFKSAAGDVLDQQLLAAYEAQAPQWAEFVTRTTVRNFKPKRMVDILGGRSSFDRVPELSEYPGADYQRREYFIKVAKFGRMFGFSWESLINDDLDELRTVPNAFAAAASATEDDAALELIANLDTGAPNTAFFKDHTSDTDSDGNPLPGPNTTPVTAALSEDALSAAITAVRSRRDHQGKLVRAGRLRLVVGVALEMTARRILNATEIRTTNGSKQTLEPNWLRGVVDLVVHETLPGNAWFIVPAPTSARPALAVAFLNGYETPDIRQKADAGQRVGGGAIGAEEGSFDVDGIYYRARHVVGSGTVDPLHTYASTGAA